MTTPDTSVDDDLELGYGEDAEDWLDEPDELPRRRRRKLLSPVPATLLVILLIAAAFFAGVQVEKGEGSSSSARSGLSAAFAALRSARGGSSSGARASTAGTSGFPAAGFPGAGGGLTSGEVSYVSGNTLYVLSGENTVKVRAPAGTTVTKTVSTDVHSIHPGDTVTVRGSQAGSGGVTASSISVGSTAAGTTTSGSGSSSGAQALFGAG